MTKTKHVQCAGGIIINQKMQVAVVNQNKDSWSLPKGHIDPGETELETAKREIYEETGITKLHYIQPIGNYGRYRIGLDGSDDLSEHKKLIPIDPHNPEAKWVDYDKVEALLTHPEDKKFYVNSIPLWINIKLD
jgi:8-oxo-dGTP diphosphatase